MLYPYITEAGLTWMLPIIFLSFCGMAFCLERLCYWVIFWSNSFTRRRTLRQLFNPPFKRKRALQICQRSNDKVLYVLGRFLRTYDDVALSIAERKTRMVAEEQVEESRKFLDILSLIANISGTLGLMGTVVGISLSFKSLVNEDQRALALSLSTAMYTTIGGIILFLFSYLFYFFFAKFSDRFENDLDININKLKDVLEIEEKSAMVFDSPKPSSDNPLLVPTTSSNPTMPKQKKSKSPVVAESKGKTAQSSRATAHNKTEKSA